MVEIPPHSVVRCTVSRFKSRGQAGIPRVFLYRLTRTGQSSLVTLFFVGVLTLFSSIVVDLYYAQPLSRAATPVSQVTPSHTVSATPAAPAVSPVRTTTMNAQENAQATTRAVPVSAVSACGVAPYRLPGAVSYESMGGTGAHVVVESPTYYHFGAVSSSDVTPRLRACAAKQQALGGYDAITAYMLTWSFLRSSLDDVAVCRLDDVRVGMRINQLLPALDESVSPQIRTAWEAARVRLYAHENEHVALNSNAARALAAQLSSLEGSCATIIASAQSLAQTHAKTLLAAHAALDSSTAHGTR